MDTYQLNHIS